MFNIQEQNYAIVAHVHVAVIYFEQGCLLLLALSASKYKHALMNNDEIIQIS